MHVDAKAYKTGIVCTVAAYCLWGILPLYWKLLNHVPAMEILAHRILWSFVFTGFIAAASMGLQPLRVILTNRRKLIPLLLSGILISGNWYAYIWAVNSNHVLEASMGYYINPLMVVLLSVFVLKEKLTFWKWTATALAAAGVVVITLQYGQVPWIALILASTFAIYGLAKKMLAVPSLLGLVVETSVVTPIALLYIARLQMDGTGSFAINWSTSLLLAGAGIITATPLVLFAIGTQRIRFSTVGFFQYIAPTITLILGVFVFRETFSLAHFFSFGLIWAGLVVFTLDNMHFLPPPPGAKHPLKVHS